MRTKLRAGQQLRLARRGPPAIRARHGATRSVKNGLRSIAALGRNALVSQRQRQAPLAKLPAGLATASSELARSGGKPRRWLRRPAWLKKPSWLRRPSDMTLWAGSSVTLGAAETTFLSASTGGLVSSMQRLGFVGAAGLTWSAVRDFRRSRTVSAKMDATGDLAWGLEGLLEFSPLASGKLGMVAPFVGTIGGLCQTAVGLRRMWQGVKARDACKIKLGALDFASGQLWLAWDLLGWENPVTVCGFVGLMIGREVYANRDQIKEAGRKLGRRVKHSARRTAQALRRTTDRLERFGGRAPNRRDHRSQHRSQRWPVELPRD